MRRTIRKRTMVELKQAIYDDRGWKRKAGENMSARIKPLYDVRVDHQRGEIVATLKPQSS